MRYLPLLLIFMLLASPIVNANENLRFQAPDNYKQNQVSKFVEALTKSSSGTLVMAPVDLNNDLIDEYIVKAQNTDNCPNKPLCRHYVIAFKARTPILLGQFDAHKILVSNKKTYGVRDLIVYNVNRNDFKFDTARWTPSQSVYALN